MQAGLFGSARGNAARRVVRVALPVPIDRTFDYEVPDDCAEHAQVGHRALVPFSGRRLTGIIVAVVEPIPASDPGARALASIDRIVDEEPVASAQMIGLLTEAATDLLCPVGLAINHALPPGASPRVVHQLRLTARGRAALRESAASDAATAALEVLADGPLTPATIARRLRGPSPPIRQLTRDGLIEKVQVETKPSVREARERVVEIAPGLDVDRTCTESLARAPKQVELLRRIARSGPVATRTLVDGGRGVPALLRALVRRNFVRSSERIAPRDVLGPAIERDRALELTPEQDAAFGRIRSAIADRRDDTFLLHGVTGSGKTEVYLRAISEALARGRRALVLVPEITLTHQIVARLRARFGDEMAVLHSGLRPAERLEQWYRLARGEVPIAVGARSALFAPVDRLGLIVVDEEHDSAYKNEEGFRYHARDLARRRAALAGCPLVLGSATPSLETRYSADRGEIERLVLARRIGGRPLPSVQIVDLVAAKAKAPRGRKLILSRPLRRAMQETLDVGGQTILFLNRRGFSTQVYCFDCGFAERCKDCDVALVYHATESRLRCHYCDYAKPPPSVCGGCGSPDTALLGLGTERVEEEVRSLFPDARLARLDRDTAQQRGHTESVLDALHARSVDILIGTQMVAKGHDFPGVQLVGVVAADLGLHMPDFRAAERTFQVLTQVAGRAGRAGTPGRVVLQTFVPEHYAIEPVSDHDYERFYAIELEQRAALGYPPFTRLCQVVISSPEEEAARLAAEALAAHARTLAGSDATAQRAEKERAGQDTAGTGVPGVEVLGPAPSPLARLRGRFRYQLLLKGHDPALWMHISRSLQERAVRLPAPLRAAVDVNPGHML